MSLEEYEHAYRDALYSADKKSRKFTQHAAAIADPSTSREEWWG